MEERPRRSKDSSLPLYTISVAARLTSLPIHTIRWLETHDIFEPARTEGRHRMFSDEDIEFLLEVAQLLERKVNLAGIRAILEMKRTHHIERIELSIEEEE